MKRILALSFFPAFVPPSNGGESRLFNFYQSLSKFHHVTLLTSSHLHSNEEKICHGSNFVERRISKDFHFETKWKELSEFSSGGDLSAVCIAASGGLPTLLHKAYLEEYEDADIIIHDSPFTIDYDLFFDVDEKIRIYNSYNCESVLYRELHPDPKSQPIWDLVTDAETKLLTGVDVVLYCNAGDLEEFKKLVPDSEYTPVSAPNGMSPLFNVARDSDSKKIESVIFIGSGHPPNTEAALKIANNIAPALPEVKFHVIGNCLPKGKYPKNVIRHGFVDDDVKTRLICDADIAINPMGMGSGSNVKVFDLFSHAVPVLSTDFGMRGIDAKDGRDCIIAPISEFSKTIASWSSRYPELQQIGANGQKFAAEHYSWNTIAENVATDLSNITKKSDWAGAFILALNDYDSFKNTGGGGVRTRGIYAAINKWRPVVFVCFSEDQGLSVRHENDKTIVFNVPKTEEHIEQQQAVNSTSHLSCNDIIAHRHCRSNALLVSIYNALKKLCRNIVIEHPYMASLPVSFHDRFVYSSQNNETQIKTDLLKYHPLYETLIQNVRKIEREAVECSSAVIAVSQNDAESFVKGVRTAGPVIVARNGASQPTLPNKNELGTVADTISSEKTAVFVGSAHTPNIDAVKFIVESLAPSCPSVEFQIVGTVCNAFAVNSASNVRFWGTLSETMKSAVMQSCSVAINTVVSGGGSNIKLADYFANGLYIVTTPFGLRGYVDEVRDHLLLAELDEFKEALEKAFQIACTEKASARSERKQFFSNHLSMTAKAQDIVTLLKNQELPKKKVLFVTYRYSNPALGGAESMLGNLIEALDQTNAYQIDVVAPEISIMINRLRFAEDYDFEESTGARVGLNNVRFARFPIDDEVNVTEELTNAWHAQPLFEKQVYLQLSDHYHASGLAWGWSDPEPEDESASARWGLTSCGLHVLEETGVHITCYAPEPIVVSVKDAHGRLIRTQSANAHFDLDFTAPAGAIEITTSTALARTGDIRPLAFRATALLLNEQPVDLNQDTLPASAPVDDDLRFRVLDEASSNTRGSLDVDLTTIRGPFSPALEYYLESNVHLYDLVVTHNNIFRPAVIAVEKANTAGVPVISIPHAHLDDDYYHFPDVHKSIVDSSLVLAAPRIACEFYEKMGASVAYLPAGVDTSEVFSSEDVTAFNKACSLTQPFILVLGRKARAKGYQRIVEAVEQLSRSMDIHLVMIGPDDDQFPIDSPNVSYLGPQPRAVIRGALKSCKALVNMSSSESFGIVLLEAWMAGKPVIVNGSCAAFHDLASAHQNALIVDGTLSLHDAIASLLDAPDLCDRLAANGKKTLKDYDWSSVGEQFVNECNTLINQFQSDTKS